MNRKLLPLLAIAFVVAVIATGIFYGLIAGKLRNVPPAGAPLVIASRNLEPGAVLDRADVRLHPWAGAEPPAGALTSLDQAVGQTVLQPISAREPVTRIRLASKDAAGLIAIPSGMRAVSIQAPDAPGVLRLLRPGHKVDVQVVRKNGPRSETELRTILQNIEVLAPPSDQAQGRGGNSVLTVLATPAEAELLGLADAGARVRVVLRNPVDKAREPLPGGDAASLFQRRTMQSAVVQRAASPPRPPAAKAALVAAHPPENTELQLRVQIAGVGPAALEELSARLVVPRRSDQLQVSAFRQGWDLESAVRNFQARRTLDVLSASSLLTGNNRQVSLRTTARPAETPAGCEMHIQFLPSFQPGGKVRLRVEPEITAPHHGGVATRKIETEVVLADGQSFLVAGLAGPAEGGCGTERLFPGRIDNANRELIVLVTPQLLLRSSGRGRTAALLRKP